MTVQTLLELKVDMMGDSGEALGVLEQTWDEQNRPTEQPGLIRVLKLTLDRCNRRGIFYPRIFLRRKGELRRGEFRPQTESQSLIDPGAVIFTAAAHPKIPAEWIRQGVEDFVKTLQVNQPEIQHAGARSVHEVGPRSSSLDSGVERKPAGPSSSGCSL